MANNTIHLSDDEVAFLFCLLTLVGGDPKNSDRGYADAIRMKIGSVSLDESKFGPFTEWVKKAKGGIFFQDNTKD